MRHGYGPTLPALYEALYLAQFPHCARGQCIRRQNPHLAWEQRQQTSTVVDTRTSPPTEFPCCDPKNGPSGVKGRMSPTGISGDAVILIREKHKDCKKAWQGRQNMPHPLAPQGERFAQVVCEHVRHVWHHCVPYEMHALRCWLCNRFQKNIMRDAALQAGEDP